MTGILMTVGAVGVMVASGIGMSAVFSFLHNFEFNTNNKKSGKGKESSFRGSDNDRMDALTGKLRGNR